MRLMIGCFWLAMSSVVTALFGLMYYEGYWRWRGCFNAEGNCFDGVVNHHAQSEVLLLPLLLSALATLVSVWLLFGRRRSVRF